MRNNDEILLPEGPWLEVTGLLKGNEPVRSWSLPEEWMHVPVEHLLKRDDWDVVNAPRPLPGFVTWEGRFQHGIFYAAGPRSHFGDEWDRMDAWPVRRMSRQEVVDELEGKAAQYDRTIEDTGQPYRALAHHYGLPWDEDWEDWK